MVQTELRLYELGLPPDIVDMARINRSQRATDVERIRSAKLDYEEDLVAVQRRIGKLNKVKEKFTYEMLHDREVLAERRVMGIRSLMSPVRRVPIEILDQIFKYYMADVPTQTYAHALVRPSVDDEDEDEDEFEFEFEDADMDDPDAEPTWTMVPVSSGPRPNPVTLCLVSQFWKYIAEATPDLWTDVHFKAQEQEGGQAPRVKSEHAAGIRKWFERMGTRPWSLSIDAVPRLSESNFGRDEYGRKWRNYSHFDLNAVPLPQVLDHRSKATLTRLTIEANYFAVGLGAVEFPQVTSIVVRCSEPEHKVERRRRGMEGYDRTGLNPHSSRVVTLPDLPRLPRLTQAVLGGVLTSGVIGSEIPWFQLTDLYLDKLDPVQWRALIKRCTSLQRGVFTIAYPEPSHQDPPRYTEPLGLVTLPNLRELVFLKGSPFDDQTPVTGLRMPGLTKLRIFLSGNWESSWDVQNAPTLFPSLRHLTITQPPTGFMGGLRGAYIHAVVSTLPGLQELFFTVSSDIDVIFNALTLRPGHQLFLPQLTALGVHLNTELYEPVHGQAFPAAQIEAAVASRTRDVNNGTVAGAAGLQSLVVHFDGREWANGLKEDLRTRLSAYTGQTYGFSVGLFGVRDRKSKLGGEMPQELGMWKHWDAGFMDFIDRPDEYSLDPSVPTAAV